MFAISMKFKRVRLFVSKGWTLLVCSVSVAVLALMSACRSKKVTDTASASVQDAEVSESVSANTLKGLSPSLAMPGDSKDVVRMVEESNALKDELSGRMRSVVYGPPEMMQRRADENAKLRSKIDSLDVEIRKARQK